MTNQDIGKKSNLDFIWLELTYQCNLSCSHCYTESSPDAGVKDKLSYEEYVDVLAGAADLGCRAVQFIGGEPTLHPRLPDLIEAADRLGYEFQEVFSNLTRLPSRVLDSIKTFGVQVATSVYGANPNIHDQITNRPGSHKRTVSNASRLVAEGIPLRVSVICMEANAEHVAETIDFVQSLGVKNIGVDDIRGFGRASGGSESMSDLCGNCAGNIACVTADGRVSPCIMSRTWSVGSIQQASFNELITGGGMSKARLEIAAATGNLLAHGQDTTRMSCSPCAPSDANCAPNCSPNYSCTPCAPNGSWKCQPNLFCNPAQ
ncbi:radical SAM protein [Hyphomonadaceae bacterium BL14]|nr:radical SAM protein [Hyphomonadaceae bacterium BL14]